MNCAATPISKELDKMLAGLPDDVEVAKVALELALQLAAMSSRPEIAGLAPKRNNVGDDLLHSERARS